MKIWALAVVAVIVGMAIGLGMTLAELTQDRAALDQVVPLPVANTAGPAATLPPGDDKVPRLVVLESQEYDFGAMRLKAVQDHAFSIRNDGNAPLIFDKDPQMSCQCTKVVLPPTPILPGETGQVVLEWSPQKLDDEFRHGVMIRTNDPARELIRLGVYGRVFDTVRLVPADVNFSDVSADSSKTVSVRLYTFLDEEVELTGYEYADLEKAAYFELASRPLTPEELAEEEGAKGGLELSVTAKPGLPLGPIQQTIRLQLSLAGAQEMKLPLSGNVSGDISFIAGDSRFHRQQRLLMLGGVPRSQGTTIKMHVRVKGPYRDEVKLRVGSLEPQWLKATLGPATSVNSGAVILYPLTVEIPSESPLGDFLGTEAGKLGRIVLKTTHPDIPELPLYISFAVE